MTSTLDKKDGVQRKLSIQVPADIVRGAFEKVYRGIQRQATLKGFRPGKAPLDQIKKVYKDRVRQDVLNDLISQHYGSAVSEHQIAPIGYPNISFDKFEEDEPFHFTVEIEVRPEIKLKKYEGLEVEKEKLQVGDDRVDKVLENLRNQYAEYGPILEDRPAQKGDFALIDFDGFVNGAPLDQGSAKDYRLELGSNSLIPGFEEGVEGMKVGQTKRLNLKFPDDYHNKDIGGKPVDFDVTVKSLQKKSIPELNEDFVKKVGKFATVDELKKTVHDDLLQSEEKRVKDDLKSSVLKALTAANPIDIPPNLKNEQKKKIVDDTRQRMSQQGMNDAQFAEYSAKWDKDFDDAAAFTIHSSFLMDALAKELNLKCTKDDLENRFKQYAQTTGIEIDKIKDYYKTEERMQSLVFQVTEEKVVDHLISKAKIKEVEKKPGKEND